MLAYKQTRKKRRKNLGIHDKLQKTHGVYIIERRAAEYGIQNACYFTFLNDFHLLLLKLPLISQRILFMVNRTEYSATSKEKLSQMEEHD